MELNSERKLLGSLKGSVIPKPLPLDFEEFLPWMCLEWQSSKTVIITRLLQEAYLKGSSRKTSAKSGKSLRSKASKVSHESTLPKPIKKVLDKNTVPMTAYYDYDGNLVEVSIVGCPFGINGKIIRIFGMCVPFHSLLYKLTISHGGVTSTVLHEISKLLPHSYLTNICLDDTNVPSGNYHVLLEQVSQLQSLSLNRCRIDDEMCKKLAENISFGKPSCSLLTLELSSNWITDIGAQSFGDVLRLNRHLLHLNLSGNMITDTGALSILNHLMEFPLTPEDILQMRRSKMKYAQQKIAVYEQYLKEVTKKPTEDQQVTSSAKKSIRNKLKGRKNTKKMPKSNKSIVFDSSSQYSRLEFQDTAKKIIGEFSDPFDPDHVFNRDGHYYCTGNMALCSLNLAYNNLEYASIKKIHEVLRYQNQILYPCTTKLLRVVIDGNYIPKHCEEYVEIDMLLNKEFFDQLSQEMDRKKNISWHTK